MLKVDSVRLSDLSPIGWGGLALSGGSLLWSMGKLSAWVSWQNPDIGTDLAIGAIAAFIGFAIAYEDGRPEVETRCESCGAGVTAHSSRESRDEYVEVHSSGTPRRITLGPLSVVVSRQRDTRVYCSGECADLDERYLVDELPLDESESWTKSEVPGDD